MSEWKEYLETFGLDSDDVPDIPMVDVLNEDGEVVYSGWYVGHVNRQLCPIGDSLHVRDVEHVVVRSSFADWNMPSNLECKSVKHPYRIEVSE